MKEKLTSLSASLALVKDGDVVALQNMATQAAPMALVRELIRQQKRELGLVVLVGGIAVDWLADRLLPPVERDPGGWAGSDSCRTCHRDHHRSWSRTWHRTMTQEARPDTVVGQFNGAVLDYWGVKVRPIRQGDRFFFEYFEHIYP